MVELNTVVLGEGNDRDLMIAHGLFGSARNWGVIQKRLSDVFRVTSVDMRNHGASPWAAAHGYRDLAGDLAATIERPTAVLGHSMGGKAAMTLALAHPPKVAALIVADIAPVAYRHTQMHLIEAMRAVDLDAITSRRDADRLLARDVPEAGIRAFLLQSLDVAERRWRLNLDVLAAEMDDIVGWPDDLTGSFDGPVLFLAGADSDYVQAEHRARITDYFPRARFARVAGAGHWLHADRPREVEASVRTFLDAIGDSAAS